MSGKSLPILERGSLIDALTHGSYNYLLLTIRNHFRAQFPFLDDGPSCYYYLEEVFTDYAIVRESDLPENEYWRVAYALEGNVYVFADKEDWQRVRLAYTPTRIEDALKDIVLKREKRLVDTTQAITFVDAKGKENSDGPWRITGVGATADMVNYNNRRYPKAILESAVKQAQANLNQSFSQGRVLYPLTGEPDHPTDKGNRTPLVTETVVNWQQIQFDGTNVLLEGVLLGTSLGRDIRAQARGGIIPALSQRGYGDSVILTENGQQVEEIVELVITGYDLKVEGEAADPNARVTFIESKSHKENIMPTLEELFALVKGLEEAVAGLAHQPDKQVPITEHTLTSLREVAPDLVERIEKSLATERALADAAVKQEAAEAEAARQKLLAEHNQALRTEMGLGATDDLQEAIRQRNARLKALEDADQQRKVDAFVATEVGGLESYPDWARKQLQESVVGDACKTLEEAKQSIVRHRAFADKMIAELRLQAKGWAGDSLRFLGPVIESETGHPAYARPALLLQEGLRRRDLRVSPNLVNPKTVNERFAAQYLEAYDKKNRHHLLQEARAFEEAEQASDLDLPYSVARLIIAEAIPTLIATSIFDVAMIDSTPSRIYYEVYSDETGAEVSVTDETVESEEDAWVDLDQARILPGTVVVEPGGGGTAFTEGTDYVIDYVEGRFYTFSTGTIGDGTDLDVDYDYKAIRKGEMAAIERAKMTLAYVTIESAADRLAAQISNEAILFSRNLMGFDAVGRTLSALIQEVATRIDEGILYQALTAALMVASNSGGTWTSSTDELSELIEKVGVAKVLLANRFYSPTALVMSLTTSEILSNADQFSAAGARPDFDLDANGYVGRLKSLPCFATTQFSDAYILVVNRELVAHRVEQPLTLRGPYPTYDVSNATSKLVPAEQWYVEEFNATETPVEEKGSYVIIA